MYFCLGRGSGCKDVFLKISLLDKIFEKLAEGPTLGSPVSLAIVKRVVVLLSGIGRVMLIRFQMLHPGFTIDSFEDVLDQKLQQGEAVIHAVSSKWNLLRV